MTLVPLVAATYFMVSGGPFGLEELVSDAGYARSVVILVMTPLVWSLPVALAVGELSAAYPDEGGYYVWVRRALGPFWGVQEAWWSIAASFFDLALYPTLFVRYLAPLWPPAGTPVIGAVLGIGLIAAATGLNLRGARTATDASVLLGVGLLSPFAAMSLAAWVEPVHVPKVPAAPHEGPLFAGVSVAMWNYMGWDNASTIAGEVENPGRVYPRAMLAAVALVTVSYLIPVTAIAHSGLLPSEWTEGTWALAGTKVGGAALGTAIAVAGMVSSGGILLALVMSYARLPLVLAKDGYLPGWLSVTSPRTGAPWVALLVSGVLYAACLGLGFKRLIQLDVIIYGGSLALELIALVVLRVKDPGTERPFRVPFGTPGAVLLGVPPMGLLAYSLFAANAEEGGRFVVGIVLLVVCIGVALYALPTWRARRRAVE